MIDYDKGFSDALRAAADIRYHHPYIKNDDGSPHVEKLCEMDRQAILALLPADAEREREATIYRERLDARIRAYSNVIEHTQDALKRAMLVEIPELWKSDCERKLADLQRQIEEAKKP